MRFLVQLYLLFQISLRLTTLWTSPLEGASFTWFRDSGTDCMSRIDRILASVDWVDHFRNVSQRVLPCVVFDHCVLLVAAGCVNKG